MSSNIKLIPPDGEHDRSVLGAGSSKFAWKSQYLNGAVINSFDWQRRDQKPEGMTMYQWNIEYDDKMRTEYEFTKYLRTIFGDLIPWVKYIPAHRFYDRKFRYEKELCNRVNIYTHESRVKFFHEMFAIQDMVLSKGWVFLDMKPDNVGLHRGTLCLIDTDPCHFYRVPPGMIEHFRVASYMIILLISLKIQIPADVLMEKMKEKGITSERMENTYQYFKKLRTVDMQNIEYYGNQFFRNEPFKIKGLMNPLLFIHHYGSVSALKIILATQTASVSLKSPVHSVNLNASDHSVNLNAPDHSSGKVSQNSSAYSMNSLLSHLEAVPSPVYYPRTPRKRLTKRRTTRILARNNVRNPIVNSIRERVLERKRQNNLEKAKTNKRKPPPRQKTAKGIKI